MMFVIIIADESIHHCISLKDSQAEFSILPEDRYVYYFVTMEFRMKKWRCLVCGFIYDESSGWPEDGIPAGTPWEAVPEDWLCPDCGVGKSDFEMIEITD